MLTETEKAYLAGVIDSDGSITIERCKDRRRDDGVVNYTLRVSLKMTYSSVIDWVIERLGGYREVQNYTEKMKNRNARPQYVLRLSGQKASRLCEMILPYMVAKKDRAQLGIDFAETKFDNTKRDKGRVLELPDDIRQARKIIYDKMKKSNSVRGNLSIEFDTDYKFHEKMYDYRVKTESK